jgi:hypothetical protein
VPDERLEGRAVGHFLESAPSVGNRFEVVVNCKVHSDGNDFGWGSSVHRDRLTIVLGAPK